MSTAIEAPRLTPKQAARRARVITAALTLAAEGGYDAVQMREVSQSADVALGTIYRYFESKDHLLAAAWVEWTAQLERRLAKAPLPEQSTSEQTVALLRRACEAIERQPRLTAALVKSLSSSDPGVSESTRQVRDQIDVMMSGILEHLDADVREGILAIIRHVWNSTLVAWAHGRLPISGVGDELERAARLLLAPYDDPRNGARRRS